MNLFRKTYTLINLDYLKYNINNIIKKYNNYTYYFGIVKANAYNHGDVEISKELIKNGINYLGVSSLDEALNIRKKIKKIDILIMSPIDYNQIKNLATEARQKLIKIRPKSIGQASRISGVNLSDISVLLVYMKRYFKNEWNRIYRVFKRIKYRN